MSLIKGKDKPGTNDFISNIHDEIHENNDEHSLAIN